MHLFHLCHRQIGLLFVLLALTLTACQEKSKQEKLYHTVERGELPITVTATGELDAKRSIKIRGPQGMRPAGIYETTLSDIVPEGTIMKKGDYVGSLDRTELANKISNIQTELDKIQTQLDQAKIDTAIELRSIRDDLINTQFALKEKRLQVDLNKYEPEAIIRQAQLDLERNERDFIQLQERYKLKQEQAEAKIREILTEKEKNVRKMTMLQELSAEFNITAPEDGMLIYARSWNSKVEPGSRITAWNPIVAELPDLSDMISKSYVNEVDISNIRKGQDVKVKIDAFPDNEYTGNVIKVANIGEQVRGYDAKVFEVIVQLNQSDSIMRPAMTTSNQILVYTHKEVLSVPLEAIYSDSVSFVYKKVNNSLVKQEIIAGPSSADFIIIEHGLAADDEVLLSLPDENQEYKLVTLDPQIKNAIRAKLEKEEAERQALARKKEEAVKDVEVPQSGGGGDDFIIIMN